MKKRFVSLFVLLSIAATLLFSCNEIDKVGFIGDANTVLEADNTQSTQVTQNEAKWIADMFMHSQVCNSIISTKGTDSRTKRVSSSVTVRENGQDLMHVFNYENGGFIIISATRNYYPILAYSDSNTFILKDNMGPVDVWLDETKVCIKNSNLLDADTKAQVRNLWARYDGTYLDSAQQLIDARRPKTRSTGEDACWERIEALQAMYGSQGWTFLPLSFVEDLFTSLGLSTIYSNICYSAAQNHSALNETIIGYQNPVINQYGPLLATQWDQGSPFNDLCPYNMPAGCAVIATAQVMKYWEYPSNMSWNGYYFTWSDIPDTADSSSMQPQLIRMVAQALNIDYDSGENGATATDVSNGLQSLGYTTNCQRYDSSTTRSELISYNRPVIMYGDDYDYVDDAHLWVCDGAKDVMYNQIKFYTENQPYGAGSFTPGMYSMSSPGLEGNTNSNQYFNMNWGWDGSFDGWFYSNNVNSGNGDYQNNRYNVYVHL